MAKKKGGFSRKQNQKLSRLLKIRRITSGSKIIPDFYVYELPIMPAIKVDPENALIKVEPKTPLVKVTVKRSIPKFKLKTGPHVIGNPINVIAAKAVEASSKTVLSDLGVKLLRVSEKPERVHALGTMIAAKAIVMARDYMPGSGGGGGGVISSIGRSSIDLSVSPGGEVSASVGRPSPKGGGKSGVRHHTHVPPAAPNGDSSGGVVKPVENVPTPKKTTRKKKDIEVGETTINIDEHGITHIHIHSLYIYITTELVQQLNVNPQLVQNVLASKLTGLSEALQKNALPKKDTENEEEDEEDDKKKKKGKKPKK